MFGRQTGDTHIDGAAIAGELMGEAAILGGAFLGNIQAGQHLEAVDEFGMGAHRPFGMGFQHAIDAETDAQGG